MKKFVHWEFAKVFESDLSNAEIGLFFRIAVAAGKCNVCRVSVAGIAKWVKSTVPWVRKSLKNLEKAGVLTVERTSGGAGNVNTYRICIENNGAENQCGKEKNTVEMNTPNPVVPDTPNPVGNDAITRSENRPQKEEYKRSPSKEECARRVCKSIVSGNTAAHRGDGAGGNTHIHTDGGFLKYYPVNADELIPYYPGVERKVAENYIFKRNSTNWVRKNGHRLRPHEILLDFSAWIAREMAHEQIPQARYSPPPERQAQQEESVPVRKSHSAELIKYLLGA